MHGKRRVRRQRWEAGGIAKGKAKRIVLRVKPRAKGKLAARKRLLFKIRLRAGGAQATTAKRPRLIRR